MASYQCVARNRSVVCFREGEPRQSVEVYLSDKKKHQTLKLDSHWAAVRESQLRSQPDSTIPEVVHEVMYALRYHTGLGMRAEDAKEASITWGHHFPRMWRGTYYVGDPFSDYSPVRPSRAHGDTYMRSIVAAESLFDEMRTAFKYAEPTIDNTSAYGHRFRELIILACTEVEACLRGILCANTPTEQHKTNYKTKDYVRLLDPMQLSKWSVFLTDYPEFPAISPFKHWHADNPTKSLPWYDAYNAVKHDRENAFKRASIGSVIEAMAAVFVMQCAQWGPQVYSLYGENRSSPFGVEEIPQWKAGEFYTPAPGHPDDWKAEMCPLLPR